MNTHIFRQYDIRGIGGMVHDIRIFKRIEEMVIQFAINQNVGILNPPFGVAVAVGAHGITHVAAARILAERIGIACRSRCFKQRHQALAD